MKETKKDKALIKVIDIGGIQHLDLIVSILHKSYFIDEQQDGK